MATARALLVDPEHALCYHLLSRCVRRAWLCGRDEVTHTDYSHRKAWLEHRLSHLAQSFAVDIYAQAIMSNHFHLVVYFDPKACLHWSDEEVAERWFSAFPPRTDLDNPWHLERLKLALINDPTRLNRCRHTLGSLSAFMQHLKQPIARRANREDNTTGHFFEQRFYSGALLSDASLLAAMAYVDLNPVRARIANHIEQCRHTSIATRLAVAENDPARLEQVLAPITSGLTRTANVTKPTTPLLRWTLRRYVQHLRLLTKIDTTSAQPVSDAQRRWVQQVASLARRQRAYGDAEHLHAWVTKRNMRKLEKPFP